MIAASVTPPPKTSSSPFTSALSRLRRYSREEYHRLGELGIIDPNEKVELLDGLVVEKPMKGPSHVAVTRRISYSVPPLLPVGWFLQTQDPIGLSTSEPEPDASVIRGNVRKSFDTRHPEPPDIGIVMEVADSTLRTDRSEKGAIYADASIAVYWIINVADGWIEVYTKPDTTANPPAYTDRTDYWPGQDVPIVLDGKQVAAIPAADLLP